MTYRCQLYSAMISVKEMSNGQDGMRLARGK